MSEKAAAGGTRRDNNDDSASWGLTWIVFMTPLARTAILPATVLTPCLNCAMSGPEGSTLSKPDALPERQTGSVSNKRRAAPDVAPLGRTSHGGHMTCSGLTFRVTSIPKQVS